MDFGLECGDSYISSYKEGANIIISIVPEFESPVGAKLFLDNVGNFKGLNLLDGAKAIY